jgi:hypothetical protein
MKIGFYITEMNYRGITNSVYNFADYNEKILKNKSFIFYNKLSNENKKIVIKTFNKRFKTYSIKNLKEIKEKENNLDYIYFQRAGHKDNLVSGIKNIIHVVFPYSFINYYGNCYSYISSWLSKICSNNKYSFVPLIIDLPKNNKLNLKNKLKIPNKSLVFGYHGGAHSFDIIFVRDAIKKIVEKNKNIYFIFLNVKKFISHKNIYFFRGHFNNIKKNKFINTCDAMIHARSLGESFGLSCGEFAIKNKPIFTYKFCRQRAHIENFHKKNPKLQSVENYKGLKTDNGLTRWFLEDWKDVGNKEYPVYRPTKRINKETPLTVNEINKTNLMKQILLKQKIKGKKNLPPFKAKK